METKLGGSSKKSRLGRLNAIKNIDYEPSSTGPSSPIYLGTQTSFRIEGVDGEIDRICWSLGLSGPDDFAIPSDIWEARKSKSLELLPTTSRAIREKEDQIHNSLVSTPTSSSREQQQQQEEIQDTNPLVPSPPTSSSREQNPNSDGDQEEELASPRVSDTGGGGGINGFTPPSLHIPLDNEQEDSPISSDKVDGLGLSSRFGETTLMSESSCSFDDDDDDDDDESENDDETTNSLPGPVYIISPNVSFKRNIKSWTKGALLGSGSFGTVYEGLSEDGFFFAVKEVSLLDQGNQAKQSILQLEQEISLLSQFEHENIVQYLGTDKDEEKLYIFLELVTKGSLAQLYQKYHLHDSQVSAYTRQILQGLMYLHDRNVVHRDIKCANILVDTKGYVKLADFGLAKATKFNDVKSCKGTAFWMAPEVVNRRSRGYGLAADIWSLGCTVLEMLTRQLPYSHLECMQALFRIGRGEPPPVSNSLSTTARDFIHRCLQVNADDRPTAALLLEHPFVNRPLSASSGSGSPSQPNWRRS